MKPINVEKKETQDRALSGDVGARKLPYAIVILSQETCIELKEDDIRVYKVKFSTFGQKAWAGMNKMDKSVTMHYSSLVVVRSLS